MPAHMCTYPENVIKTSPAYSEIIGLQGAIKKECERK